QRLHGAGDAVPGPREIARGKDAAHAALVLVIDPEVGAERGVEGLDPDTVGGRSESTIVTVRPARTRCMAALRPGKLPPMKSSRGGSAQLIGILRGAR
ncbi:MAG TPA: hypothetical protein PLV68_21335, partial [Ilumatobacteraceae bacterium]|nr:hypothetical protein [Ilumatobacteraceae bacterium]